MSYLRREALARAQRAVREERWEEALEALWAVAERAHVVDDELTAVLGTMARCWNALGRPRAVATTLWFLDDLEGARRAVGDASARDLARLAAAAGDHQAAARHWVDAGCLGHAAFELEAADDDRGARVLWERLADDPRLRDDPYVSGLVRFDLGRACERVGDARSARRARIEAMHLLEAAADGLETRGLRERAFDCYQVLLTLGREGGFENLAEGYLNCIRILAQDNLRYYVLQYYEDFQALALERGELRAAATLFREAAVFCDRHGLPHGTHYRERAADTLARAGAATRAEGVGAEVAEASYVAAVDAFAELGWYARARDLYEELAHLPLPERRRARYARLRRRLEGVPDARAEAVPFPDYLRQDTAYPEIWRLDVLEWERGGDPVETMGAILLDRRWRDYDYVRRPALLCRLHVLGADPARRRTPEHRARLAQLLGRVEIYATLAPLEALYGDGDAAVRAAAVRAVRQLFFKRSYELVARALRDDDAHVRTEAIAAVATLHFPHAFDPLSRIHREHSAPRVRRAALESIGKIASADAADYLVDVLRHGHPEERTLVRDLLIRSEMPELEQRIALAAESEAGATRGLLEEVLRLRGA